MARVLETSGIRHRHPVRPVEWDFGALGWSERNAVHLEGARDLVVEAARAALDRARVTAAEVDRVVTISSTGVATPSTDARATGRMGFRDDLERVPAFGLGYDGGVAIGARLAPARPAA